MKPIATVTNNNLASGMWHNLVETEPNVTLPVGTKLYLNEPFADLGAPLSGGFFGGEMIIEGERFALIVAPKATGEKMELEYKQKDRGISDGIDSDDDGLSNSDKINDSNHPAAQFCRELQIEGFSDWYLPSRDELMMLWRNLGPCRKNTPELFQENGAEAFDTEYYWSSTEYARNSYYAWFVGFSIGNQLIIIKSYDYGVRAVRRLKI